MNFSTYLQYGYYGLITLMDDCMRWDNTGLNTGLNNTGLNTDLDTGLDTGLDNTGMDFGESWEKV